MRKQGYQFLAAGIIMMCFCTCAKSPVKKIEFSDFAAFSKPYFGLEPPVDQAEIFMPGLITTYGRNGNLTFLDKGRFCVFTTDETGTQFTLLKEGRWTEPQHVPWSYKQGLFDYTLGGDGSTFYWQSDRLTHAEDKEKDINIWYSKLYSTTWSEPTPLPEIVNHPDSNEIYPTATADGSIYYFCLDRPDSLGTDIYCNKKINGEYQKAERLPWPINTNYSELDFIVAPDESYLIFASSRPGGYGQCDNYITFREHDGSWTHPVNMGKIVNSYGNDMRCSVTHDGHCFFFGSTRASAIPKGEEFESKLALKYGDNDVYWIDARIISELREAVINETCQADSIREEMNKNGLPAALAELQRLKDTAGGKEYIRLYELLNICEHLLQTNHPQEAESMYLALREIFDTTRIQYGYGKILVMHGYIKRGLELLFELDASGAEIDLATAMDFLYYMLKDHDKIPDAAFILEQKITRFPDAYFSICNLAAIYKNLSKTEQAIELLEKAVKLKPDFRDAKDMLALYKNTNDTSP